MGSWTSSLPLLLTLAVMVPAVVFDLRTYRIPNRLTAAAFLAGLALHAVLGGVSGIGMAALTGALLLLATFPLFAFGWLGAGDVKLLAATGAIAGHIPLAIGILLLTMLAGGVLALAVLVRQIGVRQMAYLPLMLFSRGTLTTVHKGTVVPYSLAIAAGSVVVMSARAAAHW